MTTKVIMPQMGESVFEGTLTKWLKRVGDPVTQDEPLFEISTDKVDSEIPAPASGILTAILVPVGTTIQINTVVAIINGMDAAEPQTAVSSSKEETPVPTPPVAGGDSPSLPLSTAEEAPKFEPPPVQSIAPAPAEIRVQDIRTSPLVRRLARENNVDLSGVHGTGLEGRITRDDLFAYLAKHSEREPAPVAPVAPAAARQEPAHTMESSVRDPTAAASMETAGGPRFMGESESVPMSPMRKAISAHMVLSRRTSAHVNTVFEVDVSSIVRLRDAQKVEFEKREGVPLTYTPFFAKALIDTVREFPIFNTSVVGENILYKKPINLGIAVALDSGLIVPVIRDAHLKSFTGLALAIHDLAERARNKKLKPDDVQNGTISMTNPGSFGALFATPIINQPQVAILGIGGIEKRPIVIGDAIAIRSMVCLSLTFDHRVIDGTVADTFMAKLKSRMQAWTQWID
jgi:pyruvate dehydrogenase E2 component (dihydrolipoamide acetyltransferase)